MARVPVVVIGCGAVSHQYMPVLKRAPGIEVVAVADVVVERAKAVAATYGVARSGTLEEILEGQGAELAVNLTPITAHAGVTTAALGAGKHVYSEKPLASSLASSLSLLGEARARGLHLGCAPDTVLGPGFQAARQLLEEGAVGRPVAAVGVMLRSQLGFGNPYGAGANPFLDMGPYYVTALVNLFGPVRSVSGLANVVEESGQRLGTADEPVLVGCLAFGEGVFANLVLAWGTETEAEVASIVVLGTKGALKFPDPNVFFGAPALRVNGSDEWQTMALSTEVYDHLAAGNLRGLGVAEMADAAQTGRSPRADGALAAHVVEVIDALVAPGKTGAKGEMSTTCERPAPIGPGDRRRLLS